MWRLTREALGTFADILAILFAIPTVIAGILWVWNLDTIWLKVLLACLALGAVVAVIRLLRRLGNDSAHKLRELKVENDVRQLESTAKAHPQDFDKMLPSGSLLRNMKKMLDNEATQWAEDAQCISLSYYIDVKGEKHGYSMQGFYYSQWKDVTYPIYFRDGELSSSDMMAGKYLSMNDEGLFFESKGWREAFIKIHEKLKDKISDEYRIQYTNINADSVRVTYKFKEGKVERSKSFDFINGKITEVK